MGINYSKKKKLRLQKIKSPYILKEIFSFLDTTQKLNIMIYNKKLQKSLGIDIGDYKRKSGKYKIGKKMEKEENIC